MIGVNWIYTECSPWTIYLRTTINISVSWIDAARLGLELWGLGNPREQMVGKQIRIRKEIIILIFDEAQNSCLLLKLAPLNY